MGSDVRNVSPCVDLFWVGQLVTPSNEGQPLLPIRKAPTSTSEFALNAGPVLPRLGIVPIVGDTQLLQNSVPLDHARRAQP